MTREQRKSLLLDMLKTLRSWSNDGELASLVCHCLSIINIMSEHDYYIYDISLNLRVIPKKYYKISLNKSMRQSFAELEVVSPQLRGFTGLFDLSIQENNLRIDMHELIESLPQEYHHIASVFFKLVRYFDSYDELNRLCDTQSPQALTVLFLQSLAEIFLILGSADNLINFWLHSLCVNNNIITIFNNNISCINPGDLYDKNNLILYLCLCSCENFYFQKDQINQIDFALEQARLPALSYLVEWGFVSIQA